MSEMPDFPELVSIFPLPGVVLLPRRLLPLRIFEPRYRKMLADAIRGDRLIAIALLRPGFEPLYHTPFAPIHRVIGIGQLMTVQPNADGTSEILLRGVSRARVLSETAEAGYRVGRIAPVETCSGDESSDEGACRQELNSAIALECGLEDDAQPHWRKLLETDIPIEELLDEIAATAPTELEWQQCFLEEPSIGRRCRMITSHIRMLAEIHEARRRMSRPDHLHLN